MKKFGFKVGFARRVALDVFFGMGIFLVLAFSVTLDRTGGAGAFKDIPQITPARASASEIYGNRIEPPARYLDQPEASSRNVNSSIHASHAGVDMAFARTDQSTALFLLGLIFSAVFAFNLAFFRHLRAVYAQSRRKRVFRS